MPILYFVATLVAALITSLYLYWRLFISPRITLYVPPFKVPFQLPTFRVPFQLEVWKPNPEPISAPPYAAHKQVHHRVKTDPLSREVVTLLETTTAKSQLDRKELFATPDDWLLFDIANERLITAKRTSNEVAGAGVYLVVSSAAAAENKLYETAAQYIPEEVVSRAKAKEGDFASFWEKVLGWRDSWAKEIAVLATIANKGE